MLLFWNRPLSGSAGIVSVVVPFHVPIKFAGATCSIGVHVSKSAESPAAFLHPIIAARASAAAPAIHIRFAFIQNSLSKPLLLLRANRSPWAYNAQTTRRERTASVPAALFQYNPASAASQYFNSAHTRGTKRAGRFVLLFCVCLYAPRVCVSKLGKQAVGLRQFPQETVARRSVLPSLQSKLAGRKKGGKAFPPPRPHESLSLG